MTSYRKDEDDTFSDGELFATDLGFSRRSEMQPERPSGEAEPLLMKDFLQRHSLTGKEEFLRQFTHPFLIQVFNREREGKTNLSSLTTTGAHLDHRIDPRLLQSPLFPVTKRSGTQFDMMVTLGRAKNNDIILDYAMISKFHLYLREWEGQWYINDAGSRNGTYLNNLRLQKDRSYSLENGATIGISRHLPMLFVDTVNMYSYTQFLACSPEPLI